MRISVPDLIFQLKLSTSVEQIIPLSPDLFPELSQNLEYVH